MITLPKPGPSLRDPRTCGEDLFANAERVLDLAPGICDGCSDYHIRSVLHRTSGIPKGIAIDRKELAAILTTLVLERASSPLEFFIAGAADTGILATCVHAVFLAGEKILEGTRFTVADRCRTPLALCAEFGKQHDIEVAVLACNFLHDQLDVSFDIAVLHSVMRFLSPPDQVLLLSKLGRCLKPGGRIVISQRLLDTGHRKQELGKRAEADRFVLDHFRKGRIATATPVEAIEAILSRSRDDANLRPGEMRDFAEFEAVVAAAGLTICSVENVQSTIRSGMAGSVNTRRLIAVLCPGMP